MTLHRWNYATHRCDVCGRSEYQEASAPSLCIPRPVRNVTLDAFQLAPVGPPKPPVKPLRKLALH